VIQGWQRGSEAIAGETVGLVLLDVFSYSVLLTEQRGYKYNWRLMSSTLPDLLDPWRAVDSRSVFAGRLPLTSLPRLRALLLDSAGDVSFRLAFSRDEEHRAVLYCEVSAALKLRCQRCLEALEHQVGSSMALALVSGTDEERQLPERYEPLPASETPIRPRDLIEDELLLGLPQIPMHDPDVCTAMDPDAEEARTQSGKANPFAVLAELKR
jgi:uncharacterized protein